MRGAKRMTDVSACISAIGALFALTMAGTREAIAMRPYHRTSTCQLYCTMRKKQPPIGVMLTLLDAIVRSHPETNDENSKCLSDKGRLPS